MDLITISTDLQNAISELSSIVKLKVEIDFIGNFSWVEIPQAYVMDFSFNNRVEGDTGFAVANTFTIVLNNKNKWFSDMRFGTYNSDFNSGATNLNGTVQSDGYGYLRPGKKVRVSFSVGAGNEWIQRWTGFVDDSGFKETVKEALNNVVRINCVDEAKRAIDEPSVDDDGRFNCYVSAKVMDPDDTINSLVHLIASGLNFHKWFSSVTVSGSGTTCTVSSTVGLYPGMKVTGTGIISDVYIDSITSGTVFEIDTAVGLTTYSDWEATRIRGDEISLAYDYAPITESLWTELALLAQAMMAYLTIDENGWLFFGESRYQDSYVEPTTPLANIDNDNSNYFDKSPVFSEIKNIIEIQLDEYQKLDDQNIFTFGENYNSDTGLCNHAIPASLSNNVGGSSTTTQIYLNATDIEATGYYNGWEIEIDSEIREVLSYSGITNLCVIRALSSSPVGKSYLLSPGNPIVSKINTYQGLYSVPSKNISTNELEAGFSVVYAENIDSTPTIQYMMNSVIYDSFNASRLSLEVYNITDYPDRAIIRLKNNSSYQINILKLTLRGEPTVNNRRVSYSEIDSSTASKDSPNYIGKKKESINNKYFTSEIVYQARQYMDWAAYKLDELKTPRRMINIETIRPYLHFVPGILVQVTDKLSDTGIDLLCRLMEMNGSIRAGRLRMTMSFKEAYTGHSRVAQNPIVVNNPTGSSGTANQDQSSSNQFVTKANDIQGYDDPNTGATTTPATPTIYKCEPAGARAIWLLCSFQKTLLNAFDTYQWQVSKDQSNWYSPKFDGTDWKDTLNGHYETRSLWWTHSKIPLDGTEDTPTPVTLYYRVRIKTASGAYSSYSSIASADATYIGAGDYGADTIHANNLIATEIATMFLRVTGAISIGFSGTDITSPDEGDKYLYINENGIEGRVYTNGGWSTVKSFKLGGLIGGILSALVGCQGLYHPANPPDSLEYLPRHEILLYNFEGNFNDQFGRSSFDQTFAVTQSTTVSKFGSYSLFPDTGYDSGHVGYGVQAVSPSSYLIGKSFTFGAYYYFTELPDILEAPLFHCFDFLAGGDLIDIKIDDSRVYLYITKGISGSMVGQYITHNFTLSTWNYIGFVYDEEEDEAYLIVNSSRVKISTIPGAWHTTRYWVMQFSVYNHKSSYGNYITAYLDEKIFSPFIFSDPDILIQHYENDVTWDTSLSAADLVLRPDVGGRCIFDDNHDEPSCGTLHMIEDSNRPGSYVLADGTATSFTEVDFSAYVPGGVTALLLKVVLQGVAYGDCYAQFRPKDSSVDNIYKNIAGRIFRSDGGSSSTTNIIQLIVQCSYDGIIEYKVGSVNSYLSLNILGYYI